MKLSDRMLFVLKAIADGGGVIHPLPDGFWSLDGEKPLRVLSGARNTACRTTTIYALKDRGMLASLEDCRTGRHHSQALTDLGRQQLA